MIPQLNDQFRLAILQDCAVLIEDNQRKHFIFDNMKDI